MKPSLSMMALALSLLGLSGCADDYGYGGGVYSAGAYPRYGGAYYGYDGYDYGYPVYRRPYPVYPAYRGGPSRPYGAREGWRERHEWNGRNWGHADGTRPGWRRPGNGWQPGAGAGRPDGAGAGRGGWRGGWHGGAEGRPGFGGHPPIPKGGSHRR